MIRIEIDRKRCEGHGLCEQTAPDIFELDEEGIAEALVNPVSPELQTRASAGARVCPVAAVRLVGDEL